MLWSLVRIIKIWPKTIHKKKYKVKKLEFRVLQDTVFFSGLPQYVMSLRELSTLVTALTSLTMSLLYEVLSTLTRKCLPC